MLKTSRSTMHPRIATLIPILFVAILAQPFPLTPKTPEQTAAVPAELRIGGAVSTPLVLTVADLRKMPRKSISVVNPHDKKKETYEGVLLEELLRRAGVPQGEQLRGRAMATYVIAEADDGYRVVFSLAELDSGILESEVIVADTMDGAPLVAQQGPFRLVAPHEKRPARWVRMLKSITVVGP
jgi:DMSO/TMAO reductase YedYZ molybdopterin-dependent catalytic subunit